MSRLSKTFAQINSDEVNITKSTVTQLTNITTAVTINSSAGVITTVSSTLASNTSASFTVNNSKVDANSVVLANVSNYSGTGNPVLHIHSVSAGSFQIVLRNVSDSAAFNAALNIKTKDLNILGIHDIQLSKARDVYLYPTDGLLVVKKNRDFIFNGQIYAGRGRLNLFGKNFFFHG